MQTVQVKASVLKLRSGPGQHFPLIDRLPRGMVLDWLGASPDFRWLELRRIARDGALTGWASAAYLSALPGDGSASTSDAPAWLAAATRELGVREHLREADNPRIVEYHRATSLRATGDEVPWCSSFVNWCMRQAGIDGTGSAAARSWLAWGQRLTEPRSGCVTVLRRGSNPAQGHVAFFLLSRGSTLDLLGGNQGNQVKIQAYPAMQVLGYRWPRP